MFLLLIVVGNIWGVKCDIKTDFPKSGHTVEIQLDSFHKNCHTNETSI